MFDQVRGIFLALTQPEIDGQIRSLNVEAQVMELKGELEYIKADVLELTANCESLKTQVVELEGKTLALEGRMMCLKNQLEEVKRERNTLRENLRELKTDNTKMQEKMQKLEIDITSLQADNKLLKRKVEDLKKKIHVPYDDLILGELCRCVQSMIFQKILPPEFYDDTEGYKLENIFDRAYFRLVFKKDANKISAANEAWRELQNKLKWQESDVEEMIVVMKVIQQGRYEVAHPELTEDILTQLIQRMKGAGKVKGVRSAHVVTWVTNVWKQLKMMA